MSDFKFEEENPYANKRKVKKTKKSFVDWFYKKSPLEDKTDKKILEVLSIVLFGLAIFMLMVTFYYSDKKEKEKIENFKSRVENTRSVR